MLRSWFKTLCPLALLITSLAPVCSAQNPSRQEIIITERIRLSTDLVVIDVQALNRKTGKLVTGLNAADFELYEDGVRQEITHFSQDRLALSVILLMDLSGSVSPVLKEIQSGALLALERLKESDEVAVIAFSSDTQLVQDFTPNRKLIVEKIGHIEKTPVIGQGTSLFEGLRSAAIHMNKASNGASRRVIIAVTDNVAWEYHFSGLSEKEVAEKIFESGSMVCGLVVEGAMTRTEKIFNWNRPDHDIYRRRMTVDPFATQTGGEVIKSDKTEVNARLALLIDHLRNRYSLGFSPKKEQADGSFRRISLALTNEAQKRLGDIVIRTKQGYYARPQK
ncbi:MAG TPA: VWA domain-containing protein [Blastocatellia bacterium]|nr:VWA domain-containing protein [Blastocatellia bacterium]